MIKLRTIQKSLNNFNDDVRLLIYGYCDTYKFKYDDVVDQLKNMT